MKKNDGGPAFPNPNDCKLGEEGMSLRDYFAATVAISENDFPDLPVASSKMIGSLCPNNSTENPEEWVRWVAAVEALIRYAKADAMLAEREKVRAEAAT